MRKIKEVLRLKYEVGLGQRQIARSCSIGLGTVNDYLVRAERAGIRWPLPKGWEEPEVEAAFGQTIGHDLERLHTLGKKFLHRLVCSSEGFTICASPVCSECNDYDVCFGEE